MERQIDKEIKLKIQGNQPEIIPGIVKERINETLASLPNGSRQPSPKWLRTIFSAVAILAIVVGLGFVWPNMAKAFQQVPFLSKIFALVGDPGLKEANKQGYANQVNQSAINQGITLTMTDILFDGARLSIGYTIEANKELLNVSRNKPQFEFNKNIHWDIQQREEVILGDNRKVGVLELIPFENEELPETFNLQLEVRRIGDVKGSWEFNLPVVKNDKGTKKLLPMITKKQGDFSVTLKSLFLSTRGTELTLETVSGPEGPSSTDVFYQVVDDRGMVLAMLDGSGYSSTGNLDKVVTFHHQLFFAPLKGKVKHLVIRPYKGGYYLAEISKELEKFPVTVQQGEFNQMTVTSIEHLDDKTVLYYEITGMNPYDQAGSVWLVGHDGKKQEGKGWELLSFKNSRYFFKQDYPPMDKNQQLKVLTRQFQNVSFIPELEMTVPLE